MGRWLATCNLAGAFASGLDVGPRGRASTSGVACVGADCVRDLSDAPAKCGAADGAVNRRIGDTQCTRYARRAVSDRVL